VRQNHALEHATLQILARKAPGHWMAGYSDPFGFWVVGDIPLQELQDSLDEALQRLNAGESNLAIHPYCGTNFATAGVLAGGAAWLGLLGAGKGWRSKLDRFPLSITLATLAVMFAQPLGFRLQQRVTTDAKVDRLRITGIDCFTEMRPPVHRVRTALLS
jgi:hypothetical protein